MLGKDILNAEPTIDMELLGDEVQSYINKILFLRVCEDRNIETYKDLLAIADGGEKQKSANKSAFLPKYLDNWNKYITFAA